MKKKKKRNASYERYSLKLNGIFGECQEISVNFIKQRNQIKEEKAHEKECGSSLSVFENRVGKGASGFGAKNLGQRKLL